MVALPKSKRPPSKSGAFQLRREFPRSTQAAAGSTRVRPPHAAGVARGPRDGTLGYRSFRRGMPYGDEMRSSAFRQPGCQLGWHWPFELGVFRPQFGAESGRADSGQIDGGVLGQGAGGSRGLAKLHQGS